jgi:hypothetical protein
MVTAAGMTAEQATDYLSSMGVDAQVENDTKEVEEVVEYHRIPKISTVSRGYVPEEGQGVSTVSAPMVTYETVPVKTKKNVTA